MEDETKNGSEHHHHHGEGSSGHHHHHSEEHSGHHHHHGDGSTEHHHSEEHTEHHHHGEEGSGHHHHHHHHSRVKAAPPPETDVAELIEEIENAVIDEPQEEEPPEADEAPAEEQTGTAEEAPAADGDGSEIILGEAETVEEKQFYGDGPTKYSRPSIERLRIILMFLMCINVFGVPTVYVKYVQAVCGFVPLAFFILSGYLVLRPSPNRLKRISRAIKRTAIAFGVTAVSFFLLNFIYYRSQGVNIFLAFTLKRYWFNLVALNVWQFEIGGIIWYLQSLLYAYIIIWFLEKFMLMKHDWKISAALILLTVLTGEFAGVIKWSFHGYNYIPGNFFTRALPYVLLGGHVHRYKKKLDGIKAKWYWLALFGGAALTVGEMLFFSSIRRAGYYGHLIGMGVTAVAAIMLAVRGKGGRKPGFEKKLGMSRRYVNLVYYLCQPVSIGLAMLLARIGNALMRVSKEFFAVIDFARGCIGIATFVLCFGFAWLLSLISKKISEKKTKPQTSA